MLQMPLAQSLFQFLMHPSLPTAGSLHQWIQHMDPLTAIVLTVAGTIFLFSGYKMHKLLLAMTGAVLGAFLGAGLLQRFGLIWPGAAIGLVSLGIAAWYLTSWAAAVLGSLVGVLIGAAVWNMAGQDPHYAWSGGLTGAVALGLLSFIIFRVSVIVFTSLLGSLMVMMGVLGLAYHYQPVRSMIDRAIGASPYMLPVAVIGVMVMGLVFQYKKGPAGGKAGGASSSAAAPEPAKAKK